MAQSQAEKDPAAAAKETVGKYYKTTLDYVRIAQSKQPLMVDQRNQTKFILDRAQSMKELGYIKKLPDAKSIDWTLMEQVIAENKSLYDSLKLKSA